MLDRMDPGADGIDHPRRSMGMGSDFPTSSLRFLHGSPQLLYGHLGLVWRGTWRKDTAGRNDFNDGGTGRDLCAHCGSYLVDSFYFLTDKSGMAADIRLEAK